MLEEESNEVLVNAATVSPFLRTLQTAHAVASALDLPVKVEPGFLEWLNPDRFTS